MSAAPEHTPVSQRWQRILAVLGVCLPIPLFAATGLSIPLPAPVERIAAALVPWADAATLAANEALAPGTRGSIVLLADEGLASGPGEGDINSAARDERLSLAGPGGGGSGGATNTADEDAGGGGDSSGGGGGSEDPTTTDPGGGGDEPTDDTTVVEDTVETVEDTGGKVVETGNGLLEDVGGTVDETEATLNETLAGLGN
jgi:hypothetical protein